MLQTHRFRQTGCRAPLLLRAGGIGTDVALSLGNLTEAAGRFLRQNPILAVFVGLAIAVRLVFWFYTGRVWEDAMIALTVARNVWEGVGLTHHASEPRVQSFTSPMVVLIPLLGEGFGEGLLFLRLSSLAGAAACIYFAYRIGVLLRFHWAAHVLVLSYLACDQLQVFFGMAGMETQVVTAVAVGTLYFYLIQKWWALGVTCGLAAISRPEFIMFLLPPIGVALLLFHRQAILKVALPSAAIAGPWYAFTTLYYGSPVPHTIAAKSHSFQLAFPAAPWERVWSYTVQSWRDYAPFLEFWSAWQQFGSPVPLWMLKLVVLAVAILFLTGLVWAAGRQRNLLLPAAAVLGFIAYRNTAILNSYYMWYLPPFLALGFLIAGYGLSQIARRFPHVAALAGAGLALCYAAHLPFSMPLDKRVQQEIEVAVREKTGRTLAAMMKPTDTVVLEPLGFVGWAALNKTVFDFPGLGSKVSVRALKQMRVPTVAGLANALQPTHLVLRPPEYRDLVRKFPETAAKYEVAAHIKAAPGLRLRRWGYEYRLMDDDFRILQRTRDFDQVVRP